MVGPTWMSLSCAIVKPSSACGSPRIGTSTRFTLAVRRALRKPMAEVAVATASTASALQGLSAFHGTCTAPAALAAQVSSRPASRTSVSTNIEENQPMLIRPTHFSTVPSEASRRDAARDERQRNGEAPTPPARPAPAATRA
jgi:hypothetical protein